MSTEENAVVREMLGVPEECYHTLAAKTGGHYWQDLGLACCSTQFIKDILAQLERKGQVIFFGPPGTGKTFVARIIAELMYLLEYRDGHIELAYTKADIYQMLAYCTGCRVCDAVLIYPQPSGRETIRIDTGTETTRIHSLGINLTGGRMAFEAECERLAGDLAALAREVMKQS